jgi:hypothetical protein
MLTATGLAALAMMVAISFPGAGLADEPCSGHKLLPKPRPEASCQNVTPQSYPSPDKTLIATILPVDISLYATPDMESRVVIRNGAGDTLTSRDYSSPRGINGYYVYRAQWSPDSQFFVFSLTSTGGHSTWVVSDHREIQRHDRWQADVVRRFFVFRTSYRGRHHVEAAGGFG